MLAPLCSLPLVFFKSLPVPPKFNILGQHCFYLLRCLLWNENLREELPGWLGNMKWDAVFRQKQAKWNNHSWKKAICKTDTSQEFLCRYGHGSFFFLWSFKKCNTNTHFLPQVPTAFFFNVMLQNLCLSLKSMLRYNWRLPVMLESPDFHYNSEYWEALKQELFPFWNTAGLQLKSYL